MTPWLRQSSLGPLVVLLKYIGREDGLWCSEGGHPSASSMPTRHGCANVCASHRSHVLVQTETDVKLLASVFDYRYHRPHLGDRGGAVTRRGRCGNHGRVETEAPVATARRPLSDLEITLSEAVDQLGSVGPSRRSESRFTMMDRSGEFTCCSTATVVGPNTRWSEAWRGSSAVVTSVTKRAAFAESEVEVMSPNGAQGPSSA